MISVNQHYPKWLLEEPFVIHYSPKFKLRFRVVIEGEESVLFEGIGNSVTEAAKMAREKRDKGINYYVQTT